VHGRDTHDCKLLKTLHGLLFVPRTWYFRRDGICTIVYLFYFDRSSPLVSVLYGDVTIFVGCPEQLRM
jgi:hypothetical protein